MVPIGRQQIHPAEFVLLGLLVRSDESTISMRVCAGQTSAKLALLARLRATRGTTHRQRLFLGDFHGDIMQRRGWKEWSILTSARKMDQSPLYEKSRL